MTKQQLIQLKRSYRSYCESDDNQEEQRKQFHFTIDWKESNGKVNL